MNFPLFISRRISRESAGSFSTTINRIAIVSIGLGLAVLIVAFMVLYGFKAEIRSKIYDFTGHLVVNRYSLSTSFEETSIVVSDSLMNELTSYPLTERVQPYAMKAGLLKTDEEVQGVIVKGVDQSFDTLAFSKHMIRGRFPNLREEKYSTEVALSNKIANYLKLQESDEVLIYFVQNPPRFRRLQVVGIYETGLEEFDDKIIIGDLGLVRRINNWPDSLAGGIEITISDLDKLEQAEFDLYHRLDIELYVDKVTDRHASIFDWLNLLNRNVGILLAIILFISCTSIVSIMLILIMERTQMIGVLKALGSNNQFIQRVFVWNGVQLVMKGLVMGNVVGIGLGWLQYYFKIIPLDPATYYMDHVPIVFDFATIGWLNLSILLLIGLTLFVPVTIISRIQPVKAIRFS